MYQFYDMGQLQLLLQTEIVYNMQSMILKSICVNNISHGTQHSKPYHEYFMYFSFQAHLKLSPIYDLTHR